VSGRAAAPLCVAAGLLCFAALLAFRLAAFARTAVPAFTEVRAAYQPSESRLLDRRGEVLAELRVDASRRRFEWTPLAEVSPALQAAVIAAEDRRFYQHGGVDVRALVAASWKSLRSKARRGASTITMQLATQIDPSVGRNEGPRTLRQKWQQMRLAWALERDWPKAEILEAYLNLVSFRGELQGVTAAASVLFGKAPHGLTEAEALVLAALLKAPNASAASVLRRAQVLAMSFRPASSPAFSREALTGAAAQALNRAAGATPPVSLAPHVARRLLRLTPRGTLVSTTLDADVQRTAIDTLQRQLLALRAQQVEDGAVLVVDNAGGEVLAYVGSSSGLSRARHVDGVQARRQAGSTLKPFLYALGFEQRLVTPASLLDDAPLEISLPGGVYRPQNYDGQFRGLVSVRTALAGSLNIPAVRALQIVGAESLVQLLRRLGFAGLDQAGDYYGPSLALGSGDVSLWELVNAYRTLANGGLWSPLRLTPAPAPDGQRILSTGATFLVSHILADRESRSVTFGLDNPLATRFWTAVKTGTSTDMRDNWCVGFSRRYTVGVWVGNFSGASMHDVSGVSGAAPAWLEIMEWLHRELGSAAPEPPPDVVEGPAQFRGREWFLVGTEPAVTMPPGRYPLPGIVAPTSGTVIALDPDIPPSLQRVVFEAQSAAEVRGEWVLDGKPIGSAARPHLWAPQPGSHRLVLVDEGKNAVDAVTFKVRGCRDPAHEKGCGLR